MQNDMRDRLVELIQNSVDGCASYWAELIADHLIANGVVPVVRCKDCKHCEKEYPVCNGIDEPQPKYLCKVADTYMNPDDYCSCGERKADNG